MPTKESDKVHLTRTVLSVGSFDVVRYDGLKHEFPRHSHDSYTIGVFDAGMGTIHTRHGSWPAVRGSVLVIPPDEVHSATLEAHAGWCYRAFYPATDVIDAALDDCGSRVSYRQVVVRDGGLARDIQSLHTRLARGAADLKSEELLLAICRSLVLRHSVREPEARTSTANCAVKVVRDFIESNYGAAIRISDLSRIGEVSPFHLVRSFHAAFGLPPHAYLTQVRAARARDRLLRGESITGVAYHCGFSDQSHMTRVLRAIYGITPGRYRTLSRANKAEASVRATS